MKVTKTGKSTATADYVAALDSADAFFALGTDFLPGAALRLPEGTFRRTPRGLGTIVGAATNLSLALELYLKALRIVLRLPVPKSHNLRTLYGGLPGRTRAKIEKRYELLREKVPRPTPAGIRITKGPATAPKLGDNGQTDYDLPSVLRRSRDSFSSWRYIFEFRPPSGSQYQSHQFEYLFIDMACRAIREIIKSEAAPDFRTVEIEEQDASRK